MSAISKFIRKFKYKFKLFTSRFKKYPPHNTHTFIYEETQDEDDGNV
jgi:hypothetical protein